MAFELNNQQKEAVFYDGLKPLLIEAGAGSGKTRVMTERVKFLLESGTDPESILICTFSNKAALELKNRLIDYAIDDVSTIKKTDINKMQISTVHSFCIKLLSDLGYKFKVYDDDYNEKRFLFIYNHKEDLGFVNEAYISRGQVKDIASKFSDYLEFDVDEEGLIKYIEENYPVSDKYLKLIEEHGTFPYEEVQKDKKLKEKGEEYYKDWYNAKYLQTIKAFPIYKKLLEENNATDYAFMQSKALELLKENPITQYKNILVDEFQDTDPIQVQIFEILMNEALRENSENDIKGTFTAVGDMNQNIYGFRGAMYNYFEEFDEKYDCKILSLDINHRSTNQIVNLSEEFIKGYRKDYSKQALQAFKNINRDSYYIKNKDADEEASNITKIIKYLVKNNKAQYKDILILFRSVQYSALELIEEFKINKIPYYARGIGDLSDNDMIKSIVTLFDFIVQVEDEKVPLLGRYSNWLNLRAFTNFNFNQKLVNLSQETQDILINLQDEYEAKVIEVGKIVQNEFGASRKRSFKGMFDHDMEIKEEIFKKVKKPYLSNEYLIKAGVTNSKDLEFFAKLNELKDEFFDKDYNERDSILTLFYKLLKICDCFNVDYMDNPRNKEDIENIALLTNTISNYEEIISKSDVRGFYWFLISNLSNYSPISIAKEGVQIMTIHEAKGLEYPITILASLETDKFPRKYTDDATEPSYKKPYYTPNEFLKYKIPHEQEEKKHYEEEDRIIYVGMTRAEDTLILSNIMKNSEFAPSVKKLIDANLLKELDLNNLGVIDKLISEKEKVEEDKLDLSYSAVDLYKLCPLSYYLKHDLNFKLPSNKEIDYGIIVHESLNIINQKIIEGENLTNQDIVLIVASVFDEYPQLASDVFKKQETIENVLYYFNNYGNNLKVLESEYNFSIFDAEYTLSGAIDLIYETEDGIGIIDYKNAFNITDYKLDKYTKQIYTYILALKEDPIYQNKKVTKAKIYATTLRKCFDIDISLFEDILKNINNISNQIKSDSFEQNIKGHCQWCKFNFICLD